MALTRAVVETILIKRTGRYLTAAGMDATTNDGTNADLNDPILTALLTAGYMVAVLTDVADTDLANVAAADHLKLFDLAELRTLQTIQGNLTAVTLVTGPVREDFSDLLKAIQAMIDAKRKAIQIAYGVGVAALEAGVIVTSSRGAWQDGT